MNRRVILAVMLSVLMVLSLPAPVAGASWGGEPAPVSSSHDSDSDFDGADIDNMTVSGDSVQMVDDIYRQPGWDTSKSSDMYFVDSIDDYTYKFDSLDTSGLDYIDELTVSLDVDSDAIGEDVTISYISQDGEVYEETTTITDKYDTARLYLTPDVTKMSDRYDDHHSDGIGEIHIESEIGSSVASVQFYAREHEFHAPDDGHYIGESREIVQADTGTVDIDIHNAEADIIWQKNTGGGWEDVASETTTTSGEYQVELPGSGEYRAVVEWQTDDGVEDATVDINSESITGQNSAPLIENPSPEDNSFVDESPVELSVDVSDPTLHEDLDKTVDVEFRDGDDDLISSQEIAENGTVTTHWDDAVMGQNEWYVVATDDYGEQTVMDTYSFETPNEVEIRDENTTDLIDGETEVEVRFYRADTDEVITRTTTDGVVSLSGLPTGDRLIVDARSDGYHSRQIIIESLTEQRTVYLLSEEENTVLSEFELEDRTGLFSSGDTNLLIQKSIQLEGEDESQFRTLAGDEFGASGKLSVHLEAGERYRLVAENDDGDSRSLGSYTAERDEVVPLEIGTIQLIQPEDGGYVFSARMADEEEHGENMVAITYVDDAGLTGDLEYSIHSRGNEEDVVHGPVTVTDPESYSEIVEIPENGTYEVTWQADRDGEEIGNALPVGSVGPLDLPISSTLLQVLGLSGIVLMAGLFGGTMSRTGAVVIVVVAWGMQILGIVSIPYPLLVSAGIVSIMFKVGVGGRR